MKPISEVFIMTQIALIFVGFQSVKADFWRLNGSKQTKCDSIFFYASDIDTSIWISNRFWFPFGVHQFRSFYSNELLACDKQNEMCRLVTKKDANEIDSSI